MYEGSVTSEGWKRFRKSTQVKMARAEADGFEIRVGNDPHLGHRRKWADHECLKIAQTNGRRHGYSVRTVWAVRSRQLALTF